MKQMKNLKKLKGPVQKINKGLKKLDDIQDRVTTVTDGVTDGITAMTDLTEAVSGVIPAGNMHGSMCMCFVMDGHVLNLQLQVVDMCRNQVDMYRNHSIKPTSMSRNHSIKPAPMSRNPLQQQSLILPMTFME